MRTESTSCEEVVKVLSPWLWPVLVVVSVAAAGAFGPGWALVVVSVAAWLLWSRLRRGDWEGSAEPSVVQPLVLGLVEYNGKLLVCEERDEAAGGRAWCPPGGVINFGELAEEALKRQVQPMLGALTGLTAFGAVENHPVIDGRRVHQIVLLYRATLADPARYGAEDLDGAKDSRSCSRRNRYGDEMPSIRPIVLAVIRRGDALLVFEGRDDFKDETFHRPLGGGIEFGETGKEALEREFREELAADIEVGKRLGVLENVFTWQERPGHEIVFLYAAEFADRSRYEREEMKILDDPATARWVELAEFRQGRKILYPTGLIELLSADQ
jgi:ADP-ribose pyrophosphatase YjhB (NUDIX family)